MIIFRTERSLAKNIKYKDAVRVANKYRKSYTVNKNWSNEYNIPLKIIKRTTSEGKNTRMVAYNQKNGKPVQFSHHYPNGTIFYDNKIRHGFIINSTSKNAIPIPRFRNAKDFLAFWRITLKELTQKVH